MNAAEYREANPIGAFLSSRGVRLVGSNSKLATNRCPAIEHKPAHLCVSINADKDVWHCNDCKIGGDVIRWLAIERGVDDSEILREMADTGDRRPARAKSSPLEPKSEVDATYPYHNAFGEELFQVVRMKPKMFRQRHRVGGSWVWNMDGVERVLYRLPEVIKSGQVILCEGEKDADTLVAMGFCATTNVGGAGKWLEGYTESLRGKRVVLCGDNDDAGRKHMEKVFSMLAGHVSEVRVISLPKQHKDVSDYVSSGGTKADIERLITEATPFVNGVRLEIYSMGELEDVYGVHCSTLSDDGLDLSAWLPSLRWSCRELVPGELVTFLGGTGVGKTAILSNIWRHAKPLPTLFFQLELPPELLFERMVSMMCGMECGKIEAGYRSGGRQGRDWFNGTFPNLFVSTRARMTVEDIESTVNRAELKMGTRPKLVLVDYIQLMQGRGQSRYDKFSTIAEDLKLMAKSTRTIVVIASQIQRKPEDQPQVTLTSAKESGSIENSSGLVFGAWREGPDQMVLKVLKNTKGEVGREIRCVCDFKTLKISEMEARSTNESP